MTSNNTGSLRAEAVMLVSDAMVQLIEQFRLPIWYRIAHALFPVYLSLYICTASC